MMKKNSLLSVEILKEMLNYLVVMISVLWILSVIESFIPPNTIWVIAVVQFSFVIKVTFVVGILLVPLFWFFKNPWIIRIGLVICLLIILSLVLITPPYYNIS